MLPINTLICNIMNTLFILSSFHYNPRVNHSDVNILLHHAVGRWIELSKEQYWVKLGVIIVNMS